MYRIRCYKYGVPEFGWGCDEDEFGVASSLAFEFEEAIFGLQDWLKELGPGHYGFVLNAEDDCIYISDFPNEQMSN